MRRSFLLLLCGLSACAVEPPAAPLTVAVRDAEAISASRAQVPSASQYTVRPLFRGDPSDARDINNRGQVVGNLKTYAFLHDLTSGRTRLLPDGGADTARATAINMNGVVGGWVARPLRMPTAWLTPTTVLTLTRSGEVLDLNDREEAVGWLLDAKGRIQGLFWDVKSRRDYVLPLPPGARWAKANGINNDRVIVGESDVGGVMWTGAPGTFSVRVLRGIRPLSVDNGYGTVGDDANPLLPNALFGRPDSTGTFAWGASAEKVNSHGIAAGLGYAFFYPFEAFVADRFGGFTVLPTGPGFVRAAAHSLNDCGIVAGNVWFAGYPEAVVWDPGC